ncbi:hypothetical protein OG946_08450 [Streptomyces sp. NBC_01808]|uniref:FG-GAP repeat protein n=1 Tax=Streptomyces sp. NBC_01808 TaxID=2975947 RepID=UPI002DD9EE8F|nr:FG-GAP repeat protein [Streptomyces sp. NBC_01808]WSA37403.1 hypothetical protein OG946_08450 [Streptomyces sp. NBC_01808]
MAAPPAAAAPSGLKGDFDGDGYRDVVIGNPAATVSGKSYAGAVAVLYGSEAGPDGSRRAVYHQGTAGVPGGGELEDRFGASVGVADTDADGRAEVAVGVPGEDFAGKASAGTVTLLRGTANGLTGAGARVLHRNTAGVPGTAAKGDAFGAAVALGDRNRDGRADLTVGAPWKPAGGFVWHARGTAGGITTTGSFNVTAARAGFGGDFPGFGEVIAR